MVKVKWSVLIFDNDKTFSKVLESAFTNEHKFKIFITGSIHSAKDLIKKEKIDLVFTDYESKGSDSVELLNWSTEFKPTLFLFTGYEKDYNTVLKDILHQNSFVPKPFELNELIQKSIEILNSRDSNGEFSDPANFYKITISELITRSSLDFDLFIKLSDTNFVKIGQKNGTFPVSLIKKYQLRGIKYLYIQKEDFRKLVNFGLSLARDMSNQKSLNQNKKLELVAHVGNVVLEKVFSEGIDQENFEEVKSFVEVLITTVSDTDEIFDLIEVFKRSNVDVYSQSIATAMYSVMLAKQLNFQSSTTLFKICLAGLFHDVGKKELDQELLSKPRFLLSHAEQREIENHVIRGQEILRQIKTIHSDVVRMVLEHHEDVAGLGYPFRKKRKDQHPLSRILQSVNILSETIIDMRRDAGDINVETLFSEIENQYQNRIDDECLVGLKKLFKVEERRTKLAS